MHAASLSPLPKLKKSMTLAIVRSSYHDDLVTSLEQEVRRTLLLSGINEKKILTVVVPGAFEIPLACKKCIEKHKVNGIVALGIVVQGETHHAKEIARACTDGIMMVQMMTNIPIAHGVLFVDTINQAEARCMGDKNRGEEAAKTLLHSLARIS